MGSKIEFFERIESFKGNNYFKRQSSFESLKKMEKIFETEGNSLTGKVKGGFIATVDGLPLMPFTNDVRPLKKFNP